MNEKCLKMNEREEKYSEILRIRSQELYSKHINFNNNSKQMRENNTLLRSNSSLSLDKKRDKKSIFGSINSLDFQVFYE